MHGNHGNPPSSGPKLRACRYCSAHLSHARHGRQLRPSALAAVCRALPLIGACLLLLLLLLLLAAPARAAVPDWSDERAALAPDEADAVAQARPREAPPTEPRSPRAGWGFQNTLRLGAGRATLSEDGEERAHFSTECFDLTLDAGAFFGKTLKLGFEATLGDRRVLQRPRLPNDPNQPWYLQRIEGDTWFLLPLGGYLEVYPWRDLGVFAGVHLGLGTFWPPEYMPGGVIELGAAASLELGYELPLGKWTRWAVLLHYGSTGFLRKEFDEAYNMTLNSDELSVGARLLAF